jgi:hypothetical protein
MESGWIEQTPEMPQVQKHGFGLCQMEGMVVRELRKKDKMVIE